MQYQAKARSNKSVDCHSGPKFMLVFPILMIVRSLLQIPKKCFSKCLVQHLLDRWIVSKFERWRNWMDLDQHLHCWSN